MFESVIVWAELAVFTSWLPKSRLEGEREAMGLMPFPDRATDGLVGASLVMLSVAEAGPAERGVNPT